MKSQNTHRVARLVSAVRLVALILLLPACKQVVEVAEQTDARIIPGIGVDGVKLGDSRETVIAKLGTLDGGGVADGLYRGWMVGEYTEGQHAGLSIYLVMQGATEPGPVDMFLMKEPYSGKTKEGIGIGSSLKEVRRVFGAPRESMINRSRNTIKDVYCFKGRHLNVGYTDSLLTVINMGYYLPMPKNADDPCN